MCGKLEIPTLKVLLKILCPITHCILRYKQLSNTALNRLSKNYAVTRFLFMLGNCENEALFKDKSLNQNPVLKKKSSLPVDCLRKFAMGDNTCNFWCGQCNVTMHNTFFRITGPIPNFSKKSISLEPLYKSKNDFWSFSCIMLALKSERKRSLLINVAPLEQPPSWNS